MTDEEMIADAMVAQAVGAIMTVSCWRVLSAREKAAWVAAKEFKPQKESSLEDEARRILE